MEDHFHGRQNRYQVIKTAVTMNVRVLQHVPFEGLGSIQPWLEARGANISVTRFFAGGSLPLPGEADFLIAMGGPMSVNDERKLSWLRAETQFIRDSIAREIPVLGICLGAQLIASALGAAVHKNPLKEIGWFPVQRVESPAATFQLPPKCTVFHWHGETFDLPKDAIPLAKSAACENQAFQIGSNVIGLQFHLETTPESAAALIESCRDELAPGPFIQGEDELRRAPAAHYRAVNRLMEEVLAYLTGRMRRSAAISSAARRPNAADEFPPSQAASRGGRARARARQPR